MRGVSARGRSGVNLSVGGVRGKDLRSEGSHSQRKECNLPLSWLGEGRGLTAARGVSAIEISVICLSGGWVRGEGHLN